MERRRFLTLAAYAAAAGAVAACGAPPPTPSAPARSAESTSAEAKPAAFTPPQEFAYDIPTKPGATVILRAQ